MSARDTTPLLDESRRLLLRASTRTDDIAVPAFVKWRQRVDLNDVGSEAHRVMVTLVDLATRNNLPDRDLERMRGVHRHVWTGNTLRLRHLFAVLDALGKGGIQPFLMKGGALLARFPELAARRPSGDYDIVVKPEDLPRAAELLAEAGYHPLAMAWQSLVRDMRSIDTSGTAIAFLARDARVDFHWRPLGIIPDDQLTLRLFELAEPFALQGRPVLVPSPAHHLFLCLARTDPSDKSENFRRLLEADMLLKGVPPEAVDWAELERLVRHYGLEAIAAAFFRHLGEETSVDLPAGLAQRFAEASTIGARFESWARRREVQSRAPLTSWLIMQRARRFGRASAQNAPIGLAEAIWRNLPAMTPGRLNRIRSFVLARTGGASNGRRKYLEGWFYNEAGGRWSNGKFGAIRVPLTPEQHNGAPVTLRVRIFTGRLAARLLATGGLSEKVWLVPHFRQWVTVSLKVKPEPSLGGDGLVVFWAPDASRPSQVEKSPDTRLLGLFVTSDP
jgi:hypothetical protein